MDDVLLMGSESDLREALAQRVEELGADAAQLTRADFAYWIGLECEGWATSEQQSTWLESVWADWQASA